ncbi:aminomethyltransferase family protein [Parahalioglobus pacificus]|uniref:Glycine cleavage system protein T n=1 Tax=Parahalioglobus pacificus TaxID=930806 RepID=A0A918XGT4_9GAMM|nr:aminomethyltransferase family protein [Halioglobus pacificus]NQY03280.1 aminomethyl transferase family protein [Halieaceae bacterium]GHD31042.1 glycine cleavage system protein T [Halioglobus pacificus]
MNPHQDEPIYLPTAFHSRQQQHNLLHAWGGWNGYLKPEAYTDIELEYFAIRSTTAVFDLSPMNKYRVTGPDAEAFLNRVLTRDVAKIKNGRVGYCIWCDDAGQVMDDGTLFHLGDNDYRLCSYTRAYEWLYWSSLGFDVAIEDETGTVAALAVQGPTSCTVLTAMGVTGLESLKPFGILEVSFQGQTLTVSRTGFTGDLGYELWIDTSAGEALWDALFAAGEPYLIKAIGTEALEIARIEAGFLQAGVDFVPAETAVRRGCTRSPFELGLGWLVDFDKPRFNGRKALLAERDAGSRYRYVMLDVDGNKPAHHSFILQHGKVVGTVTSAAWCPTAKTNLAFAQLELPADASLTGLVAEIYYERELRWNKVLAPCVAIDRAPFDPPRRRQTPAPAL